MKKVVLSFVALLIAGITFGQVKWGVLAGPNFSSYTIKPDGGDKETSKLLANVRAGVTADIPLADEFFIGTGLLFAGKGGKDKDFDFKANLAYLQLPVNFVFKPEVGSGSMVLGAGPYLAYGIAGKYKGSEDIFGSTVSVERKAFDDESGDAKLKRFDAGIGVVVGYEMINGLFLGINADLGLVNALDETSNGSFRNTSFGASVGYKFGGR